MKVSVILPTYNERENIAKLIRQIRKYANKPEIIVVDDDSPDKTWKVAKSMRIKVIRRKGERGLASAIWTGIKAAKGEVIIWMDADLTHAPSLIPKLLEAMKTYDVVVASRYVSGGQDKRKPIRVVTSWLFNFYASNLLRVGVKDADSGYLAVRQKVFRKVKLLTSGYGEYFVKFVYDVKRAGFSIKELPCIYIDRQIGSSKTGEGLPSLIKHGWQYGLQVLKLRFGVK